MVDSYTPYIPPERRESLTATRGYNPQDRGLTIIIQIAVLKQRARKVAYTRRDRFSVATASCVYVEACKDASHASAQETEKGTAPVQNKPYKVTLCSDYLQ